MRNRRTDLALEARELWQESAEERTQLEGVEAREEMREGIPVTRVSILDRRGEEALGKPVGTYVTLTLDGLASRSLKRVCRTVQLADTGIAPGSGVGNHRAALDRASLGVPVIAVGVPTVVDGATLAADLLGTEELPPLGEGRDLMVTPKDIDSQVADLSKVIGYGIDLALQPSLTLEDLDLLLS